MIDSTTAVECFPDKVKEACGVVGVYSPKEIAARKTYFALYALQHRGQESSGIAASDGMQMNFHKHMGLVSQVFTEDTLTQLRGHIAIGHNRYATSGSRNSQSAGPYVFNTNHGMLALAHNGNITNTQSLRALILQRGGVLSSNTDSELLALLLAAPLESDHHYSESEDVWVNKLLRLFTQAQGAFSLTVLTQTALYALRDPLGLRPLCLGSLPKAIASDALANTQGSVDHEAKGYVVASESCALDTLGAKLLRDIDAGEVIRINHEGIASFSIAKLGGATPPKALCVFECVYFSRPDSVIDGRFIHATRQAMGGRLAEESPVEADLVIPVPDSSIPAALGFSQRSTIPYSEGFTKSRYIGRTFIEPDQTLRQLGIRLKFNPLSANVKDKRVVLIDDSIVRGNTIAPLIAMLRHAGAIEVHVRVSSPPVRHPCFMGVDMAISEELIANQFTLAEICKRVGADSLAYLSLEGLMQVVQDKQYPQTGFCSACFSGNYPLKLDTESCNKP